MKVEKEIKVLNLLVDIFETSLTINLNVTRKRAAYLMMVTLFIVVGLVGGDEDGLVGGVALELLAAEALRVGRVQVEPGR
jgi:hypothetical protein